MANLYNKQVTNKDPTDYDDFNFHLHGNMAGHKHETVVVNSP